MNPGKIQLCAWLSPEGHARLKHLAKSQRRGMGPILDDLLLNPPTADPLESRLATFESRLSKLELQIVAKT